MSDVRWTQGGREWAVASDRVWCLRASCPRKWQLHGVRVCLRDPAGQPPERHLLLGSAFFLGSTHITWYFLPLTHQYVCRYTKSCLYMYSALLSPMWCYLTGYVGSIKRGTLYRVLIQAASAAPGLVRQHREDECRRAVMCMGNLLINIRLCQRLPPAHVHPVSTWCHSRHKFSQALPFLILQVIRKWVGPGYEAKLETVRAQSCWCIRDYIHAVTS